LREPHEIAATDTGVSEQGAGRSRYNVNMPRDIPSAIGGQKYISLTTFRKNGTKVATPVWFGEDGGKLYVMTRSDLGKTKRIRNNPQVRVAPCTMRGKVTGPEYAASARILPVEEHAQARQAIDRKYWMARLPLIWRRTDTYLELTFA
jgi:PPOX class probable F420-dependent enzyme